MRTTFLSTQNLQRGREGRRFWTQRKMTCLRTLTLTPRSLRRCQGPQRGGGNRRRRLQIMNQRSSRRKRSHRGTLLQGVTDGRARIQFLRSAVGCGEEEPCDELREALSGDALLLPQQGDRDGEGGEADLQVRSQHEGLPRQGQKRPELPAERLNKSFVLLFKIHSVPRQTICK